MPNKVVIRFLDGRIERGYTADFQPHKEIFHLVVKSEGQDRSLVVKMANLKAVFFVKELHGMVKNLIIQISEFADLKDQKLIGKKVRVEFLDGEVLNGITLGYSPQRRGFFLTPIDPESNNERIFAVLSAVKDITFHD